VDNSARASSFEVTFSKFSFVIEDTLSDGDELTSVHQRTFDVPICDFDRKAVDLVLGWEIAASLQN